LTRATISVRWPGLAAGQRHVQISPTRTELLDIERTVTVLANLVID
jgi:hypothetical protein